jgi:hypothetical protein
MLKRRKYSFSRILRLLFLAIHVLIMSCGSETPAGPDETGAIDSIAPAAVTDLLTKTPTINSLTLLWTAPGDDGMAGTASQYDVRYSTVVITEQNWDTATPVSGEPVPKPANQLETFQIIGLVPASDYYFAIKSKDNVFNESGLSNVVVGTTIQETSQPSTVMDLAAVATDDTSFMLAWTAPGDDGITGTATQYDVRYSTEPISEQNWSVAAQAEGEPQPSVSGSMEGYTITGLAPMTNYFFILKAADEVPNWSELSNSAPAIGYSVFLWVYPETIHTGEEVKIIYRVSSQYEMALSIVRRGSYYECGGYVTKSLVEGTYPEGIYSLSYDFFDNITHNYMTRDIYFIPLCWDLNLKANVIVRFQD